MVKSLLSASSRGVPNFYDRWKCYHNRNTRIFLILLRPKIDEIDPMVVNFGSGSFQKLTLLRVELRDPEPRYFILTIFSMLFKECDKLLPLHIIQGDVDIFGLLAQNLRIRMRITLSLTQPPATRSTVFNPSSSLYCLSILNIFC